MPGNNGLIGNYNSGESSFFRLAEGYLLINLNIFYNL